MLLVASNSNLCSLCCDLCCICSCPRPVDDDEDVIGGDPDQIEDLEEGEIIEAMDSDFEDEYDDYDSECTFHDSFLMINVSFM